MDSAIPTVNQMSSRPTHPVNPQFLSDLHNLPFGRIFAHTLGSVKLSRAGVQGVVQGAGRFPISGQEPPNFQPSFWLLASLSTPSGEYASSRGEDYKT